MISFRWRFLQKILYLEFLVFVCQRGPYSFRGLLLYSNFLETCKYIFCFRYSLVCCERQPLPKALNF